MFAYRSRRRLPIYTWRCSKNSACPSTVWVTALPRSAFEFRWRIMTNVIRRAVLLCSTAALIPIAARSQAGHQVTKADVDRWMIDLSNWGRWGKDDQLGALNLVTASKRKEAAGLVKEGYTVSLAHDVMTERAPENQSPYAITWTPRGPQFASDNINVSYHGYVHSHLDA